jgi:hypothetical protein
MRSPSSSSNYSLSAVVAAIPGCVLASTHGFAKPSEAIFLIALETAMQHEGLHARHHAHGCPAPITQCVCHVDVLERACRLHRPLETARARRW